MAGAPATFPTKDLWRGGDRLALGAGTALGLAAVLTAWFGASGEATTSHQLVWVTVGAAGIAVSGLANAVWLLTGRRAVGRRRAAGVVGPALALLESRRSRVVPTGEGSPAAGAHFPAPEFVVATQSMKRYHRPDCLLVAGKPVQSGTVSEQAAAGRTPCGVCAP